MISLKHIRIVLVLLIALGLCPRIGICAEPENWWGQRWRYRAIVRVDRSEAASARVRLRTGDRALPAGKDLRVVSPDNRVIPFHIVHSTSEKHLIQFPTRENSSGDNGTEYAIYFGNSDAAKHPSYSPKSGLTLRTAPIPEDVDVSSWESASDVVESVEKPYGVAFRRKIFTGYNPLGPQEQYLSIYNGVLQCPRSGTYRFAVLSQDASFLLVDGKKVAEWTGRGHNIHRGRYGQHAGAIELQAGRHSLRYVAFAFDGPGKCAAAWVLPGTSKKPTRQNDLSAYPYQILGEKAFGSVAAGTVLRCEARQSNLCAAFDARNKRYLESRDARMVAVRFRSHSSSRESMIRSYQWDFGDGQTSDKINPTHVYLKPGTYKVSLRVKGTDRTSTFTSTVKVEPVWHDLNFRRRKKRRFWKLTRNYDPSALPTDHLLAFRQFLHDIDRKKKLFEVCRELDSRRDELTDLQIYGVAFDLANHHVREGDKWQKAEKYYHLALRSAPEDAREKRFNTQFELADLYFYYADRPEKARTLYHRIRKQFSDADPVRRRVALIRLGDIARNTGKMDRALEIYRQAQKSKKYGPGQSLAVVEGRYIHDIRSALQKGDGQRAVRAVRSWLWTCPTARLDGLAVVFQLRANMLAEKYHEVKKQARIYLSYAEDPNYIPRAHLYAGEACHQLGETDEARKHWETILQKWRDSPAVRNARRNLQKLEVEEKK